MKGSFLIGGLLRPVGGNRPDIFCSRIHFPGKQLEMKKVNIIDIC